jgi:hypothetical protein
MNETAATALTAADLQCLVRQADPAALLVAPRILRRVIKQDRSLPGLGLQVPHRKSYVIARDALLRIAGPDELGLAPDGPLPDTVLLLPHPDAEQLERLGRVRTLVKYWRLLFHARVHLALARRRADGKLTAEGVRERIGRIGPTEFDEARRALRQEHFLLPPALPGGEDVAAYEEFAALYLEIRHFAPELIPTFFPAILGHEAVDAVLEQDVDAAELLAATRPEGAPLSLRGPAPAPAGPAAPAAEETRPDPRACRRLLERAARKAARGNVARAAILRTRAAAAAEGDAARAAREAAGADLDVLAGRLQRALDLPAEQAAAWRQALAPLLAPAAGGLWPVEARLLYDLQKVCADQERDTCAVDLVEWFVSWGRRPVVRLLPHQRDVLAVKHLRGALHRLTGVRLAAADRARLASLVQAAVEDGERRLRERLRPAVGDALDAVGLTPRNVAEGVSRDKLIEELLDRVVERNFLTLGDLRDAIARNRVKLPDLVDPVTFFLGDRLILANRRLAAGLDGIYRRGEIYLRWLQRLSSAAFGNPLGRFLTRFVALPFGGAYMLLKTWEEVESLFRAKPAEGAAAHSPGVDPYLLGTLGTFFLLLIHVAPFRRGTAAGLRLGWRGLRGLCYDLPATFLGLSWVQRVVYNRVSLLLFRYVLKPLVPAALAWLGVRAAGGGLVPSLAAAAGVFLAASALVHSRLGAYLEEVCADGLVRAWHRIRSDLLPGLVRWVLFVFRRLLEDVERFLYSVDEWLRFRKGDSRWSLFVKPVLGLAWFAITYLIRLVVNVFVEPTFNPIKHFPVVTVTAKLLLPFYFPLRRLFAAPLEPVFGKWVGDLLAWSAVALLPGLAGFLVWELKENWRLYRANQSPTLDPEVVGHHGETVLRLLRPGLHSGTLPKLYAKLRRSRGRSARRQHEALDGVVERLRRFVERDLLAILATSKTFAGAPTLEVGEVRVATNRIRIELRALWAGDGLFLEFEDHAGRLLAGTAPRPAGQTWLTGLSAGQVLAFRDALAGFYKLAGVALVREQVEAAWPAPGREDGPDGRKALAERDPVFESTPIRWEDWVRTWEADHTGTGHAPLLPASVRLLHKGSG